MPEKLKNGKFFYDLEKIAKKWGQKYSRNDKKIFEKIETRCSDNQKTTEICDIKMLKTFPGPKKKFCDWLPKLIKIFLASGARKS